LESLLNSFNIIIEKILSNYNLIGDNYKSFFENEGFVEQMIILSIFNFHHNLNNLKAYPEQFDKINMPLNKDQECKISFSLYNHNILQDEANSKKAFVYCKQFIKNFISILLKNFNQFNLVFTEKFLTVIFYWMSINFEFYNDLISAEDKSILKFLNHKLQNNKSILNLKSNPENYSKHFTLINKCILPIESMFYVR
jgi:hypothetical protein